jgi:glycosyltransferase involved in cell wall biosynthesis
MLNIAYIAYTSMDHSGVAEKILCQVQELQSIGSTVHLIFIDSLDSSNNDYSDRVNVIYNAFSQLGIISSLAFQLIIPKKLFQTLNRINPDIIYLRYPLYRPWISRIFSETQIPLVIEINGNPLDELKSKGAYLLYLIEKYHGKSLLNIASGFVGVSENSINYALKNINNKNTPYIVIGNGVDCNKVNFLNIYPDDKYYNIAYVGDYTKWAGIDRLVQPLLKDNTIKLHLIGEGWGNAPEIKLLLKTGIAINHGYVPSGKLSNILNNIDVGIGPLGVHRKKFYEATPLKVRRYLAHGIPVILGYNDTDIHSEYNFVLKVSSNDEPIDLDLLKEYVNRIRINPNIRNQARWFAVSKLGYKIKMMQLSNFLSNILERSKIDSTVETTVLEI